MADTIGVEVVASMIFELRGKKGVLDKDLAALYGVTTFNFNKAVKRNMERFPDDFMFQLSHKEFKALIFHFGISRWGGTRKLPYAFTEQGVAMLSSVLHSHRAIKVNIHIMRAFVKLREVLLTNKELALKIERIEKQYNDHDEKIHAIFEVIKQVLQLPTVKDKPSIGFHH